MQDNDGNYLFDDDDSLLVSKSVTQDRFSNLDVNDLTGAYSNEDIEENVPKLFSEDQSHQTKDTLEVDEQEKKESDQLFDQDLNEDEEFEIPAFLRKQKF